MCARVDGRPDAPTAEAIELYRAALGSPALQALLDAFVDDIPRLRDLAYSNPRMWKLFVFTSLEDKQKRRKLQQLCLDALPDGCRNALVL